jgi:hypothetical protein
VGNYTTIYIYPCEDAFNPDHEFLNDLFRYLGIEKCEIASGSRLDDDGEQDNYDFFLQNAALDEALALAKFHGSPIVRLMLPYKGFLRAIGESLATSIPADLAGEFLPWDTSVRLRHWEAFDYDTGESIGLGRFAITKSGSGCPPRRNDYLNAFNPDDEVQKLLAYLESRSGCAWGTLIELT